MKNLFRSYSLKLSIGLVISFALVICAFEWKFPVTDPQIIDLTEEIIAYTDLKVIEKAEPKPQPPKPPIVKAETLSEVTKQEPVKEIVPIPAINIEPGEPSTDEWKVEDEIAPTAPYTYVEEMPSFENGNFNDFIAKNFRYPKRAIAAGIKGTVFVEFIIDTDGSIAEVKILKGLSAEIDEEALRVISKAPKWKPGRQGGRFVKVKMVIPIKLDLNKP